MKSKINIINFGRNGFIRTNILKELVKKTINWYKKNIYNEK